RRSRQATRPRPAARSALGATAPGAGAAAAGPLGKRRAAGGVAELAGLHAVAGRDHRKGIVDVGQARALVPADVAVAVDGERAVDVQGALAVARRGEPGGDFRPAAVRVGRQGIVEASAAIVVAGPEV